MNRFGQPKSDRSDTGVKKESIMPFIAVKVFEKELSAAQTASLIHDVTEAVMPFVGEGLRDSSWVVVEEVKSSAWSIGGKAFRPDDVRDVQAKQGQSPSK
jgi:phenylpyruvate tautomerase PptA (4-oxalocrotonate tautomerase family)